MPYLHDYCLIIFAATICFTVKVWELTDAFSNVTDYFIY